MGSFLDKAGLEYLWNKIKPWIPRKVSQLENDSGYITGYTETDPTVPEWAKQDTKPSYSAGEVGAAEAEHSHDDRYYTESEMDTKLSGKANASHTHDDRYYTESETDTKLATKYPSTNVTTSTADLDLNNYKTTGIYHCTASMTNAPLTNHGTVVVDWNVGTKYQLYFPDNQNTAYKRTWNATDSAWNAWTQWKFTDTTALGSMTGTLGVDHGGTGQTTAKNAANALIDALDTATANWTDDTLIVTSDASGDTDLYYKRAAVRAWNYIKGRADSVYAAIGHNHDSTYVKKAGDTMTGDLKMNASGKGYYGVDSSGFAYPYARDNGSNLWIGATQKAAQHHKGSTFISAGHNGTDGNSTIYVSVPNAANNSASNYGVYHTGNKPTSADVGALPLAGGTLTGRLTTTKTINQIVTGSGTAASDKGSGVSPRYFPAKWTFNTGLTATNGDIITIKLPVAGHDYGVFMSIDNGSHYYPVVVGNGTGRLTTHYANATPIMLMFDSSGSAASMFALNGADARATVTGGVWRVINFYDTNTVPQAYCSTAAATAAKYASMSGYVLTANRYVMVTITNANTAASAITLSINGTGYKPIYINGSASSASNYTLPAGSYLVYYNGTNYYFRTDGQLNGPITAGTAGTSSATSGNTIAVPYVTYNSAGQVTASGTHTHTITNNITGSGTSGKLAKFNGTNTLTSGPTVTVSSSSPSGGSNGDIWFKY